MRSSALGNSLPLSGLTLRSSGSGAGGAGPKSAGKGGSPANTHTGAEGCKEQICQTLKLKPSCSHSSPHLFGWKALSSAKQSPYCTRAARPQRGLAGTAGISLTRSQGPTFWKCVPGRASGCFPPRETCVSRAARPLWPGRPPGARELLPPQTQRPAWGGGRGHCVPGNPGSLELAQWPGQGLGVPPG